MSEKLKEVFSSGGGTQSCAIAALIVQGRLPKPDYVVIADTHRERSTTWDYMQRYVAPALLSVGVEVHRALKSEFAKEDIYDLRGKTMLIPAYTDQTGEPGKLRGLCSDKWKVRVRNRYLRQRFGIKRPQFRAWVGYSLDEVTRVVKQMRGSEYRRGLIWHPLVSEVPMRREQSISLVEQMGWPTPPRSNCWMCPNQSDSEWIDLKENHPEEFAMACALEREIQQRDSFAWLHKSCVPLDQVRFKPADHFSRPCESGACFI